MCRIFVRDARQFEEVTTRQINTLAPSNQQVEEREADLFAAQLFRVESLFKPRIKPLNPAFESFEQDHLLLARGSYSCSMFDRTGKPTNAIRPLLLLSCINEESKAETDLRR